MDFLQFGWISHVFVSDSFSEFCGCERKTYYYQKFTSMKAHGEMLDHVNHSFTEQLVDVPLVCWFRFFLHFSRIAKKQMRWFSVTTVISASTRRVTASRTSLWAAGFVSRAGRESRPCSVCCVPTVAARSRRPSMRALMLPIVLRHRTLPKMLHKRAHESLWSNEIRLSCGLMCALHHLNIAFF